jgi:hypothetical protein
MERRIRITRGLIIMVLGLAAAHMARAADGVRDTTSIGRYQPTTGFTVAATKDGSLNIRLFTYIRYLNQQRTDSTSTNAFGTVREVQRRQDIQVNKLQVYFFGWIMDPKLRYLAYVWTSNTSLGQSSQVVVAGNVTYRFDEHFTLGGGISALPGVRSTEGNFPYWLAVDERPIADEYARPSYTTGIFANGKVVDRLNYQAMLGNNLSQFGIDAGQLDNTLDTYSGALVWTPTTGEYGKASGFGDFDQHDKLATRFGVHATTSEETRQGQPNTDAFDNVQIRVSDGSVIFAPGLFAPGVQIDKATYRLFTADAGFKHRGYSLEGEHYWRRIDNFDTGGTGSLPFGSLEDTGFQLQASAMVMPYQLQVYVAGSKIFGQYGNPGDFRVGATLFPYKNQVVRWNLEVMHLDHSPVGALSLPYSVGSNGTVVHSSFMLWF